MAGDRNRQFAAWAIARLEMAESRSAGCSPTFRPGRHFETQECATFRGKLGGDLPERRLSGIGGGGPPPPPATPPSGVLYTAMCSHANSYDGSVVPKLHVTDLVKFRGPTAAASWTVGLTDKML
jgi:hypothetical protein